MNQDPNPYPGHDGAFVHVTQPLADLAELAELVERPDGTKTFVIIPIEFLPMNVKKFLQTGHYFDRLVNGIEHVVVAADMYDPRESQAQGGRALGACTNEKPHPNLDINDDAYIVMKLPENRNIKLEYIFASILVHELRHLTDRRQQGNLPESLVETPEMIAESEDRAYESQLNFSSYVRKALDDEQWEQIAGADDYLRKVISAAQEHFQGIIAAGFASRSFPGSDPGLILE